MFITVFGVGSALWAIFVKPGIATNAQIARSGRDVDGVVITDGSGNHGICTYYYEVNGAFYDGSDACDVRVGRGIVVRYVPSDPQLSGVEGAPPANDGYPLFGISFAAVGFALVCWFGIRRTARWLATPLT